MRWDLAQPFTIAGWIVIDGAGGGFIAIREIPQPDRDNLVCGATKAKVRAAVADADGIRPIELATRQRRRRRPDNHLRSVS